MASLYKRPDSPFWWINCKDSSGKWRGKNTGTKDRERAETICESLKAAENLARERKLSPEVITEMLVDTLARTGVKYRPPVPIQTILAETCALPISGSFVYLIQSDSLVKIGKTSLLRKRMAHYRAHNPGYRLLGVRRFETDNEASGFEKTMHERFKEFHKENEWFQNRLEIKDSFSGPNHGSYLIYLNFL